MDCQRLAVCTRARVCKCVYACARVCATTRVDDLTRIAWTLPQLMLPSNRQAITTTRTASTTGTLERKNGTIRIVLATLCRHRVVLATAMMLEETQAIKRHSSNLLAPKNPFRK